MSLPVWEEWIEIQRVNVGLCPDVASLPVWEEWIEIVTGYLDDTYTIGLFPYGKSGLKSGRKGIGIGDETSLFPYGKSGLKSI